MEAVLALVEAEAEVDLCVSLCTHAGGGGAAYRTSSASRTKDRLRKSNIPASFTHARIVCVPSPHIAVSGVKEATTRPYSGTGVSVKPSLLYSEVSSL